MDIIISALVVCVALGLLIFLAYKGVGEIFGPLLCVLLVALVSYGGFGKAVFTDFPQQTGSFISNIMLPSITGYLFAQAMATSGAGESLGRWLVSLVGVDNSPYIIMVMSVLLSISGVTMIMFIIAALSHALMKASDLPNYIGLFAYIGFADLSGSFLPGAANMLNLIPTIFLGTDLYAGAIPGIAGFLVGSFVMIVLTRRIIRKARANKIGFDQSGTKTVCREKDELPKPIYPMIATLSVIMITFVMQKIFFVDSSIALFVAQLVATGVLFATCHRFFSMPAVPFLQKCATETGGFLLSVGCLVGFSSLVSNTPLFTYLNDLLAQWNINPYLFTAICVSLFCAIAAEANTGMMLFLKGFAPQLLANGANAALMHRIVSMSCIAFDSFPHGAWTILNLKAFGYTHKVGYKYYFIGGVVVPTIALAAALIVTLIIA